MRTCAVTGDMASCRERDSQSAGSAAGRSHRADMILGSPLGCRKRISQCYYRPRRGQPQEGSGEVPRPAHSPCRGARAKKAAFLSETRLKVAIAGRNELRRQATSGASHTGAAATIAERQARSGHKLSRAMPLPGARATFKGRLYASLPTVYHIICVCQF